VKAEAAKIAASASTPTARAEQALRLVQDRIRYVYVGLEGGNYRPARQVYQRRTTERVTHNQQTIRPAPADWSGPDAPCSATDVGK
jgi:hypothetical protein